jgi:hypothetical protein
MVVLRSTTPCVNKSSSSKSNFFTLNSISCAVLALVSGLIVEYGYCTSFLNFYKDKKTVAVAASVDFRKSHPTCITRCA